MYDRTKILWNRRVRQPHRHYQPIKHKGHVQSLQAKCCEVLLYTFPKDEVITKDFSLARDVPLGMAKYTYHIQIILNSKVLYETKRLMIQFLIELDAEKQQKIMEWIMLGILYLGNTQIQEEFMFWVKILICFYPMT